MTQQKTLKDSPLMRWSALAIVSFTMMAAYYVNDVMAPLKSMLENDLAWSSSDYGFFTGGYSFLNVFLLMLIWGGLMLDKFGIRLTGKIATILMVVGVGMKYLAISGHFDPSSMLLGHRSDVMFAFIGYAIFGVGAEVAGITVTKIIAKWFKGKEMASAMGLQVALARIGSQAAYAVAAPMAKAFGDVSAPVLMGAIFLLIGTVTFFIYSSMDKRLEKQISESDADEDEEKFSFADVKDILCNSGFWLIALLCVLFYSCVFPFQKYATELMQTKYGIDESLAGAVAGLPALGALFLTPIFGGIYDKKGKGATMMLIGAIMLIFVHATYSLPFVTNWVVAIALMIVLGIAFSLVPSAMWPSVAKIFPARQLGTAYALIFFIQNIGLWGVPTLIGSVLDKYCVVTEVPAPVAQAVVVADSAQQAATPTVNAAFPITPDEPRAWALQNLAQYSQEAAAVSDAVKAEEIEKLRQKFKKSGFRTVKYEKNHTPWQVALAQLTPEGRFADLAADEALCFPAGKLGERYENGKMDNFASEVWMRLGKMAFAVMQGEAEAETIYTDAYLKSLVHYINLEISRNNYASRFHPSCFQIPTSAMNIYYTFLDRMEAVEKGEVATELEKEVCKLLKVVALQAWTQPIRKDATDLDVSSIDRFRKHVWWVGGNGLAYRSLLPVACMIRSIPMVDVIVEAAQRGISCTSQNSYDTAFWTEGFTADGAGWGHGMQCLVWGYPVDGTNAALSLLTSLQGTVWAQTLSNENKAALFNYLQGSNWYHYKGYDLPCLDRHSAHYLASGKEIKSMILVGTALKNWKDSFSESEVKELEQFTKEADEKNIRMEEYPQGIYHGTRWFFNNDDLIKKNNDYHIIVNLASVRCDGIESAPHMADAYNFTNADGLTLFQRSGREYMDMLGAYDPLQAPGVTARLGFEKLTPVTNWRGYCSKHNFAGAATLNGANAVTGFKFEKMNASDKKDVNDPVGAGQGNEVLYGVKAHKAYFMVGDYTVALGAGITNLKPEMEGDIHTSMEQTSAVNDIFLYADGQKSPLKEGVQAFNSKGGEWIVQEGKFAYTTLPEYTPMGYVQKENRPCDWVKRNPENKKVKGAPASAEVLQLWADHGQTPVEDTYGYVVYAGEGLPAAELPFTVLRNDTAVQAISSTAGDVIEAVFYDATASLTLADNTTLSVSAPSVVLLERVNNAWNISVGDAQMDKDLTSVQVTVDGKVYDIAMPQGDQCGRPAMLVNGAKSYDYTLPMMIFTGIAVLSFLIALLLKREDKRRGYGLEEPNI